MQTIHACAAIDQRAVGIQRAIPPRTEGHQLESGHPRYRKSASVTSRRSLVRREFWRDPCGLWWDAMLTPSDVHFEHANTVLTERGRVLEAAYDKTPERFLLGKPRPPTLPHEMIEPKKNPRKHPRISAHIRAKAGTSQRSCVAGHFCICRVPLARFPLAVSAASPRSGAG